MACDFSFFFIYFFKVYQFLSPFLPHLFHKENQGLRYTVVIVIDVNSVVCVMYIFYKICDV